MDNTATAEPGTAVRHRRTVHGMPGTQIVAEDTAEQAVIGHMRGWCHDSTVCGLCDADTASHTHRALMVRMEARVRTEERRRIDTEISNAYLARELMRATMTVDSIISG